MKWFDSTISKSIEGTRKFVHKNKKGLPKKDRSYKKAEKALVK